MLEEHVEYDSLVGVRRAENHLAVVTENTEVHALTRQLVRYRSYTPGAAQSAMDFINGWFGARGFETMRYTGAGPRGDLSALVARVGAGDPRILLHGHVDVVPGEESQFEPRDEGDELYGRGVYDMKGALAAMAYAIDDLQNVCCEATVGRHDIPDEEGEHGAKTGAEVLI